MSMKVRIRVFSAMALAAAALLAAAPVGYASPEPGVTQYHIGYDNRPTFATGTYAGKANPNFNRLTFFLSHTYADNPANNHFHRIGSYVLTGPAATPSVGFSTNDRTPEPFLADDGLALLPGSGPLAGKLVSGLGPAEFPGDAVEQEYGLLTIEPMDKLIPFDNQMHPDQAQFPGVLHPKHYLVNTSGGIYKYPIAGTTVSMELTAITPGLSVHDASGATLLSTAGARVTLGPTADWALSPVFAVDAGTPAGSKFSATFILKDAGATPKYGDSAPFSFDFVVVPEPQSLLLVGLAATGLAALRRRG